jgi:hypothetical protein
VSALPVYVGAVHLRNHFELTEIRQDVTTVEQQDEFVDFDDITLTLQADGSFTASGTVRRTMRQTIERTSSNPGTVTCNRTIDDLGSGPVTGYSGRMPDSPKGQILAQIVPTVRVDSVTCSDGSSLSQNSSFVGNLSTFNAQIAVMSGAQLVELDFNLSASQQDPPGPLFVTKSTQTAVGQLTLVP